MKKPTHSPTNPDLSKAPRGPERSPIAELARQHHQARNRATNAASNFLYEPAPYRLQQLTAAAAAELATHAALNEAVCDQVGNDAGTATAVREALERAAANGI